MSDRSPLRRRMIAGFAMASLIVMALFGFLADRAVRGLLLDRLTLELERQARVVALDLGHAEALDGEVDSLARTLDARITVIGYDGTVIADSARNADGIENHGSRPEVQAALAGDTGVARRVSRTLGASLLYVAVPGDGIVVRLSVSEQQIAGQTGRFRSGIIVSGVLALLVGLAGMVALSRRVVRPIAELTDAADRLAAGDLDVPARRSGVAELDRLGGAIGSIASELGDRIEAVESERRRLAEVLDSIPQGVLLVGPDDRVEYANLSAVRLLGGRPETGRALSPTSLGRLVDAVRSTGQRSQTEMEFGAPTLAIRAVATPVSVGGSVVLAIADITERHRTEAMRRDFVADASHELKTPVAGILASAETLEMALGRNPEDAGRFAAQIRASASQLGRIVNDLLDLSRLEAEAPVTEPLAFDELVRTETERFAAMGREQGVTVRCEVEPVIVEGSAADLALAVSNLCDNALRYTDPGGEVIVTVRAEDEEAVLVVADTGAGIPSRFLPRVFERFFRVDVARSRATGGTGLGLAIVKHVVERHGGSVSVVSELGSGSIFSIRVPRSPA